MMHFRRYLIQKTITNILDFLAEHPSIEMMPGKMTPHFVAQKNQIFHTFNNEICPRISSNFGAKNSSMSHNSWVKIELFGFSLRLSVKLYSKNAVLLFKIVVQIAKPKTETMQYMVLFSHLTVQLPSVELSQ